MVLRCLTKMAKADPILRVEATKADSRWTVEAQALAPWLVKSTLSHYVETDELAYQIAVRHQEEIAAHRKPASPPEPPEGFLRGPEGARWAMRAWMAGKPSDDPQNVLQSKPPPTPEPVSDRVSPEELKEHYFKMFGYVLEHH
ncbi:MAG TPA: hypothetical protein VK988_00725 [Acidimicrobiales bacterium]|nr:hypothetical protein [Acidimicrobiales bacterium]